MSRLPPTLSRTALYPLWVALLAAAVLFIGLGSHGLWEPHEVRVANRANDIANPEADATEAPTPSAIPGQENATHKVSKNGTKKPKKRAKPPHRQLRSELSERLIARAISLTGRSELSSRAPLALLAFLTVMATFFLGLRVAGPRAGLYAALIVLTFPALLMHGRHLTSEIGSAAGSAIAALGLIGLLTRRGFGFRPPEAPYNALLALIDVALIALGVWLSYRAAGALLGAMPPLAGAGAAGLVALVSDRRDRKEHADFAISRIHFAAIAGIGLSLAIGFFFFFVFKVFDLVDPADIENAKIAAQHEGWTLLGGRTFIAETEYVDALAGVWRAHPDLRVGFSGTLESMAFGAFPWIAVVPIAGTLLLIGRPGRARSPEPGRTALILWALVAYTASAIFTRKVGVAMYPAWAALAAICGVWLADVFRANRQSRGALPLAAFFVIAAGLVVGKDLLAFPERLTSLNLTGATLDFPKGVRIHFTWVVLSWASLVALGLALAFRDRTDRPGSAREVQPRDGDPWWRRLQLTVTRAFGVARDLCRRGGVAACLALAVLSSAVFTQVVTPTLSGKVSAKNILGVYKQLRDEGDVLGIMGNAGGASYYAGTDWERIRGRKELLKFLGRSERVFALAPVGEQCPLNKAARKAGRPYYVVDNQSAQFLLYSNQLKAGEVDKNPLTNAFFSEKPKVRKPLSFTLDNRLELIGVSMPDSVRKGSTFKMKLIFKVKKLVSRNWKIFVHFDGGGVRFQADHDPINGTCGTAYWLPGDYVVDEFEVEAGSRTHPRTTYRVYAGLFVGSGGNWTNMTVSSEGADKDNRMPIGTITLR